VAIAAAVTTAAMPKTPLSANGLSSNVPGDQPARAAKRRTRVGRTGG
jgi:hypothetical protein